MRNARADRTALSTVIDSRTPACPECGRLGGNIRLCGRFPAWLDGLATARLASLRPLPSIHHRTDFGIVAYTDTANRSDRCPTESLGAHMVDASYNSPPALKWSCNMKTFAAALIFLAFVASSYWIGTKAGSAACVRPDPPPRQTVRLRKTVSVGGRTFDAGSLLQVIDRQGSYVTLRRYDHSNAFLNTFDFWLPSSDVDCYDPSRGDSDLPP